MELVHFFTKSFLFPGGSLRLATPASKINSTLTNKKRLPFKTASFYHYNFKLSISNPLLKLVGQLC